VAPLQQRHAPLDPCSIKTYPYGSRLSHFWFYALTMSLLLFICYADVMSQLIHFKPLLIMYKTYANHLPVYSSSMATLYLSTKGQSSLPSTSAWKYVVNGTCLLGWYLSNLQLSSHDGLSLFTEYLPTPSRLL